MFQPFALIGAESWENSDDLRCSHAAATHWVWCLRCLQYLDRPAACVSDLRFYLFSGNKRGSKLTGYFCYFFWLTTWSFNALDMSENLLFQKDQDGLWLLMPSRLLPASTQSPECHNCLCLFVMAINIWLQRPLVQWRRMWTRSSALAETRGNAAAAN